MQHCGGIRNLSILALFAFSYGVFAEPNTPNPEVPCEVTSTLGQTRLRPLEEGDDLALLFHESALSISFWNNQILVDRRADRPLRHFLSDGFLRFFQDAFRITQALSEQQAPADRKRTIVEFRDLLRRIGKFVEARLPTDPSRTPRFWELRRIRKYGETVQKAENGLLRLGDVLRFKTADAHTRALFLELLLGELCISAKLRAGTLEAPNSQTPFLARLEHAWVEVYAGKDAAPFVMDPSEKIYGPTHAYSLTQVRVPEFLALQYQVQSEPLRIVQILEER